jgi:hypothetical protein
MKIKEKAMEFNENKIKKAVEYKLKCELSDLPGGVTPRRMMLIRVIIGNPPYKPLDKMRLEVCRDEHTGSRYGRSACRIGQCAKIGNGGRNYHSKVKAYQIWLVWS